MLQKQTDLRPYENATYRARLDRADTDDDANESNEGSDNKNKKSTRSEAVRTAKARITRRNSLRKQREALKG